LLAASQNFQAQIFAPKSILLGFYRYQSKAELKSRSTIFPSLYFYNRHLYFRLNASSKKEKERRKNSTSGFYLSFGLLAIKSKQE